MQNTPSVQDILRKGQTLRLGSDVEQNSEPDLTNKIRQKFKILLALLEAQNQNREVTDVRSPVNVNFASIESTSTHGNTPIFSAEPKSENSQSSQEQTSTGNFQFALGIIPPQGPQSVLSGPPQITTNNDLREPQLHVDIPNETTANQVPNNDIVLPDGTVLHSTSADVPPPLETAPPPTPPPIAALESAPPNPLMEPILDTPPLA